MLLLPFLLLLLLVAAAAAAAAVQTRNCSTLVGAGRDMVKARSKGLKLGVLPSGAGGSKPSSSSNSSGAPARSGGVRKGGTKPLHGHAGGQQNGQHSDQKHPKQQQWQKKSHVPGGLAGLSGTKSTGLKSPAASAGPPSSVQQAQRPKVVHPAAAALARTGGQGRESAPSSGVQKGGELSGAADPAVGSAAAAPATKKKKWHPKKRPRVVVDEAAGTAGTTGTAVAAAPASVPAADAEKKKKTKKKRIKVAAVVGRGGLPTLIARRLSDAPHFSPCSITSLPVHI